MSHNRGKQKPSSQTETNLASEQTKTKIEALIRDKYDLSVPTCRINTIASSQIFSLGIQYIAQQVNYLTLELKPEQALSRADFTKSAIMSILVAEIAIGSTQLILHAVKQMADPQIDNMSPQELMVKRRELEQSVNKLESTLLKEFIIVSALCSLLVPFVFDMVINPATVASPLSISIALFSFQYLEAILSILAVKIIKFIRDYQDKKQLDQLEKSMPGIFPDNVIDKTPQVNTHRRIMTVYLSPFIAKNTTLQDQVIALLAENHIKAKLVDPITLEVYMDTNKPLADINKLHSSIAELVTKVHTAANSPRNNTHAATLTESTSIAAVDLYSSSTPKTSSRHKKSNNSSPRDITTHEATPATACKQITWTDNSGNKIMFDAANNDCPVKAINGGNIPAHRLFLFFPLTINDFADDNGAFQKFKTLADHALIATQYASEGIRFMKESKSIQPMKSNYTIAFFPRAKIKALGDYGDARVYCEQVTSDNGEQLYIARRYIAHTHTRV